MAGTTRPQGPIGESFTFFIVFRSFFKLSNPQKDSLTRAGIDRNRTHLQRPAETTILYAFCFVF